MSLLQFCWGRTRFVVIGDMVDSRAHGIRTHEAGVIRLQEITRNIDIEHLRVQPQVVISWIEDYRHAVRDGTGDCVRSGSQN